MQEGPRVEKCPIAIKDAPNNMFFLSIKLAYGPVHRGYIKNHIKS